MCTRYALLEEHYRAVLQRLGIAPPAAFPSRYNIGPGVLIPAVRTAPATAVREATGLHWGWTPPWARSPAEKLLNIRAESVEKRALYRDALRSRRCIIPASGFYEWQKAGTARRPFFYRLPDGQPFGFAGLWQPSPTPESATMGACAIVTTAANETVRPVHDRMPVILKLDACEEWLAAGDDPQRLVALLGPLPAAGLSVTPVSPRMSNVRYAAPDCIEPVPVAAPPEQRPKRSRPDDGQFSLGI